MAGAAAVTSSRDNEACATDWQRDRAIIGAATSPIGEPFKRFPCIADIRREWIIRMCGRANMTRDGDTTSTSRLRVPWLELRFEHRGAGGSVAPCSKGVVRPVTKQHGVVAL